MIEPASVVIGADGVSTVTVTAHNAIHQNRRGTGQPAAGQATDRTQRRRGALVYLPMSPGPTGSTTDATLTVPAGDTAAATTLTGLTSGVSCTISEPAPTPGFTLTSITPNPVVIAPGDQPSVVVTATNDRQLGSLQVVKQLTTAATSPAQFVFTLDCDGTAFDRNLTLDIPAGATTANTVISGLPVGLHCNVTEPQSSLGYQPISITPSGGVTVGSSPETVTITATNTAIPGALQIIKHLVGGTADEVLPIQLHLACTNPSLSLDVQITLPAGASTGQTLESGLPAGANCTVTEPSASPPRPRRDHAHQRHRRSRTNRDRHCHQRSRRLHRRVDQTDHRPSSLSRHVHLPPRLQ